MSVCTNGVSVCTSGVSVCTSGVSGINYVCHCVCVVIIIMVIFKCYFSRGPEMPNYAVQSSMSDQYWKRVHS